MFSAAEYTIDEHINLSVIDIPQIDDETKCLIDDNLVYICEGDSGGNIDTVKKDLVNLFSRKPNDWVMGAIAEFFMHLYIRQKSYKQEFVYQNLEEKSIKKGFDGLYTKNNVVWLMESKSGSINTEGISHKSKISEAMTDLKNKVAGINQTNNPWKNAYNHASLRDVNASDTLRSDLKKLSDDFTNKKYGNITNFNTIPCGTIFLNGQWQQFNAQDIFENIKDMKSKLLGKNIFVICMTQNTVDMFINYINS